MKSFVSIGIVIIGFSSVSAEASVRSTALIRYSAIKSFVARNFNCDGEDGIFSARLNTQNPHGYYIDNINGTPIPRVVRHGTAYGKLSDEFGIGWSFGRDGIIVFKIGDGNMSGHLGSAECVETY